MSHPVVVVFHVVTIMSRTPKTSVSVRSQAKSAERKSQPPIKVAPKRSNSPPSMPSQVKLDAWLNEQAIKLSELKAKGGGLKLDFVQNAKEQGEVLLEVSDRLSTVPGRFMVWVSQNTDIGYSTAQLWMDIAKHPDVLQRLIDSNPLEVTLRKLRDALRDERQKKGNGKPGSGKKRATATVASPPEKEVIADDSADEDVAAESDMTGSDAARWERTVSVAEAEAAKGQSGDEPKPVSVKYKVTVTVFSDSDQDAIYRAFSNWSPLSTKPTNPKQQRSVIANARPKDIGNLLQKLGDALGGEKPMTVRLSIEPH